MSGSTPSSPSNPRQLASSGRRYSAAFKQDALLLITQEGYGFATAAHTLGVSEKSLREWHKKLAGAPEPCDEKACVKELQ